MKIRLSGNLLRFADHRRDISVEAKTLREGVHELVEQAPMLRAVLLDADGRVQRFHRFFINGEQLGRDDLDDRPVTECDELTILTAIAGG
jgi:predicted phage tail protein